MWGMAFLKVWMAPCSYQCHTEEGRSHCSFSNSFGTRVSMGLATAPRTHVTNLVLHCTATSPETLKKWDETKICRCSLQEVLMNKRQCELQKVTETPRPSVRRVPRSLMTSWHGWTHQTWKCLKCHLPSSDIGMILKWFYAWVNLIVKVPKLISSNFDGFVKSTIFCGDGVWGRYHFNLQPIHPVEPIATLFWVFLLSFTVYVWTSKINKSQILSNLNLKNFPWVHFYMNNFTWLRAGF